MGFVSFFFFLVSFWKGYMRRVQETAVNLPTGMCYFLLFIIRLAMAWVMINGELYILQQTTKTVLRRSGGRKPLDTSSISIGTGNSRQLVKSSC